MNPIFYDIMIVAVILISGLLGRRKGLVLTLCGFLALFVALIGSAVLTNFFAPALSRLVVPFVETHLAETVQAAVGDLYLDTEGALHATFDQLLPLMERSELLSGLKDGVAQAVQQGALDVAGDAVVAVAAYVAEQLTRLVLFPLFFVLLMLLWTALSHILDLAFRLPGLNFLNRSTGLLLGLARGVLLVLAACWLLRDSYLTQEVIGGSFLLPYFTGTVPLLNISTLNS